MECAGVFLISTEGALFGPSKYGLLPEFLPETKLSWGNGIIEFGTFLVGHPRHDRRGESCRTLPRPRSVAGLLLLGCHRRRTPSEPRNIPSPRRGSEKEFQLESAGRFRHANEDRFAPIECSVGQCSATHISTSWPHFSSWTIVIYGHDVLWIRTTPITPSYKAQSDPWHRTWQRRRRVSLRRKN